MPNIYYQVLYAMGLACYVWIPLNGKMTQVYRVWYYDTKSNMYYILNSNYPLLYIMTNECILQIKKIAGMKRHKLNNSQIWEEMIIKGKEKKLEKIRISILKHYERLNNDIYLDGVFRMNYMDLPDSIDKYLSQCTIEKLLELK